MYSLKLYDLVLGIIYLSIIIYIFKYLKRRYLLQKELYRYFLWGFRIKILFILAYTILTVYVIKGDSISLFFEQGRHFKYMITEDFSKADILLASAGEEIDALALDDYKGYLMLNSNFTVVKISTILCLIGFSSFLSVNLIIGFIAFLGSWYLFLFFRRLMPMLHLQFAVACMGIPTVIFWSSGISKDTICIACLGFLTKGLFDIIIEKKKLLFNGFLVIASTYFIYTIKQYIFISYFPFFIFFLALYAINKTANDALKTVLKLTIPLIFLLSIIYIYSNSESLFSQYSSEKLLESVSTTQNAFNQQSNSYEGAFFSLGDFDGSIGGLIRMAPMAIITTFFRPFLWESRNLIMVLSGLEGLTLLFLVLRLFFAKNGVVVFFRELFTNSIVMYCFFFALLFSVFVGISTFNFGSLVRYKIPCVPFFGVALAILYYKTGLLKSSPGRSR